MRDRARTTLGPAYGRTSHHPAGAHDLGQQDGQERREDAQPALPQRVVEAAPDQHHRASRVETGGDAAGKRPEELSGELDRTGRHR
jgi:hypothetical protein